MIDIGNKNNKCILCKKTYAHFCKKDETKATHCGSCAKIVSKEENIEMICLYTNKCIKCKKTTANFCIEGGTKPTHCSGCSKLVQEKENIKMFDIKNKKCKNILDGIQCQTLIKHKEKYDGYCFKCYYKKNPDKIPIINRGIKENAVVEFIKLIYTKNIREKYKIKDIIFDKPCGNTNKKPDIVIVCENNVIVVEIDEFQHKLKNPLYSKENEKNKMKLT